MSHAVPARARQLAAELEELFARDAELARALNDAHQRLCEANERLWTGLHPDGLSAVYGEHPAFEAIQLEAAAGAGSAVLESKDQLGELQRAHWQIHQAHIDYQHVAEERRQLAANVGEHVARFVDALVDAGWTPEQARNADVHALAHAEGRGDA